MAAKSFKQMRLDGEIKRADSEQIEHCNIHPEPGFNPPDRTAEDDEQDEALFQFIMDGGFKKLPPLEVRPREGGGVFIVDGHRRHKQIGRAIAAGAPIANPKDKKNWIPVTQFDGNDIKRTARILTSNQNKTVSAQGFVFVYERLKGFGLSPAEIAKECNTKLSHVQAHLILASGNHDVQAQVAAGEVSTTNAVAIIKKHGDAAGAVLNEAKQAARLQGKSKVTAKQIAGNTPRDLVDAIIKDRESGGTFKAEELAPHYADLILYLRGTSKGFA